MPLIRRIVKNRFGTCFIESYQFSRSGYAFVGLLTRLQQIIVGLFEALKVFPQTEHLESNQSDPVLDRSFFVWLSYVAQPDMESIVCREIEKMRWFFWNCDRNEKNHCPRRNRFACFFLTMFSTLEGRYGVECILSAPQTSLSKITGRYL